MPKIVAESIERCRHFFTNYPGGVKEIGQTKRTFVMDILKDTPRILRMDRIKRISRNAAIGNRKDPPGGDWR